MESGILGCSNKSAYSTQGLSNASAVRMDNHTVPGRTIYLDLTRLLAPESRVSQDDGCWWIWSSRLIAAGSFGAAPECPTALRTQPERWEMFNKIGSLLGHDTVKTARRLLDL